MEIDKDFALFYGILLGDGCIGKYKYKEYKNKYNYNISITCNALDDKPFFDKIVSPLIFKLTGRKIPHRIKKEENTIYFNFCNKKLFYKLKDIGFPLGKKGPNLFIPKVFFERGLIKYVIQGFFATDGSLVLTKNPNKYYPRLESQTIHKNLISQIHEYFCSIGMKGHKYDCSFVVDIRFKTVQRKYKFQFNGVSNLLVFKEQIGFVNPKQQDKFEKFIKYSKAYDLSIRGIPFQKQSQCRINFLDAATRI